MGVKPLVFLIAMIVLISACSTEKTKPVITDITGAVVQEEEPVVEEETAEEIEEETTEDEVIQGETEEEINESEGEINETEPEILSGAHIVVIKNLRLEPQELTIKKGDTVVWNHEDTWEVGEETRHYLTAHSNEFRSPIFYYGETFEHTFEYEGIFTYIDVIYKDRVYLRGTIVVEE